MRGGWENARERVPTGFCTLSSAGTPRARTTAAAGSAPDNLMSAHLPDDDAAAAAALTSHDVDASAIAGAIAAPSFRGAARLLGEAQEFTGDNLASTRRTRNAGPPSDLRGPAGCLGSADADARPVLSALCGARGRTTEADAQLILDAFARFPHAADSAVEPSPQQLAAADSFRSQHAQLGALHRFRKWTRLRIVRKSAAGWRKCSTPSACLPTWRTRSTAATPQSAPWLSTPITPTPASTCGPWASTCPHQQCAGCTRWPWSHWRPRRMRRSQLPRRPASSVQPRQHVRLANDRLPHAAHPRSPLQSQRCHHLAAPCVCRRR